MESAIKQTMRAPPVPELGSLLVPSVYAALENWQVDELQAHAGHRTYSIAPQSCKDQPEP